MKLSFPPNEAAIKVVFESYWLETRAKFSADKPMKDKDFVICQF